VGCASDEDITLKGVNFHSGSDRLTDESSPILNEAVATLKRHPDIKIKVIGHTDSQGAKAANRSLSLKRASAVRKYLISKGINSANLSVSGYGESKPIASNTTSAGRALNRRVELKIIE